MNRKHALSAAIACVIVACIAGWFRPTQLATHAIGGRAADWRLPSQSDLERSSAAQYAAIAGVAWAGTATGDSGAMNSEWTLLGVVGRADDRAILVLAGKDPLVKRFRTGDTLPDGSRLASVGKNGIIVDRDGCRTRRPLYPAAEDDAVPDDACLPSGQDRGQ